MPYPPAPRPPRRRVPPPPRMTPLSTEQRVHTDEAQRRGWRLLPSAAVPGVTDRRGPVYEASPLAAVRRRESLTRRSLAAADGLAVMLAVATMLLWVGPVRISPAS